MFRRRLSLHTSIFLTPPLISVVRNPLYRERTNYNLDRSNTLTLRTMSSGHFFSSVFINNSGFPLPSAVSEQVRGVHTTAGSPGDEEAIPCSTTLTIGDVQVPIPDYVRQPERVSWVMPGIDHTLGPLVEAAAANEESKQLSELALNQENPFFSLRDPLTRSHLRWMAQKEILGQDMCLIGDQGPAMRWLVQLYSFLTRREICTVNLNRDVTESDLKQRREIRNKTLVYEDQGAVTAAKRGQLLVLEGLEKVERNVLPVINNLLENREMHLDNGQILIHPARYDSLLRDIVGEKTTAAAQSGVEVDMNQLVEDGKKQLELMGLLRVSEKFKVIGITVPVPPYEGNPLDPPLRSRFQCLYVRTPLPALPSTSSLTLGSITTTVPKPTGGAKEMEARMNTVSKLRMSIEAVNSSTGDFRNSTTEAGEEAAESGGGGSSTPLQNVGNYELSRIARQLITFPDLAPGEVLYRGFPWHLYSRQMMNTDDQRRRFSEYAKILGKCQLSPPLLLAEEASKPSSASHSRSSSLSDVSRQASDALKAVMGGAPTSESIRSYLLSGQLVGGRTKVTTGMEQSCNYFRRFKNIRVATALSTCDDKVERTIVVADAEVGTATRGENGKDFFTLPVYMGSAAPALYGNGEVEIGSVCPSADSIFTTAHYHVLQTMLQCHATRQHMALIGPTGCGKTALVREFTKLLGYEKETTHLYADMTNKDFFQRRTTDAKTGNTTWENAALVEAAIHGKLVVLDGIDKLSFGMLASLQQLLVDQNANLFDGTVLKPAKEYEILKEKLEMSDAEMREKKIFPIHPAFRVIATARPPGEGVGGSQGKPFTISQDVTTLFSVITMPDASETTLEPVLLQVAERELQLIQEEGLPVPKSANTSKIIHSLLSLRTELESIRATDPKVPQLTFRQLLHLAKGAVRYPSGVSSSISSALLLPLMSGVSAAQVTHALESCGFSVAKKMQEESLVKSDAPGKAVAVYKVGDYPVLQVHRAYTTTELALVPFVTGFYPNKVHETIIAWLGKQYAMRSNILLIGNQGVGKNKVVDTFLSRIQLPRHYIQLHRDTTVGSLTINPTVEGGKVRWEDSPLVKAVMLGHCLVVDEIDKAPVEVVQVLKGLIEDHEMRLGDGRQIINGVHYDQLALRGVDVSSFIRIHEDFRMIVLANPPGFPFHGNDFFRECGDLFSSFVMDNPDAESQLRVLTAYAPNIPHSILRRLIDAFEKLQQSFREGNITYPFSLRELIAVVKHMSRYPQDGVYEALNNVFNFDARDENTLRLVRNVLNAHLVQSIQKTGGMGKTFPFHVQLPKPHQPQTTVVPVPLPKTENDTFSVTLNASVINTAQNVRDIIFARKRNATDINAYNTHCWKENYLENEFSAVLAPHQHQQHASDWFTDWVGTQKMPFLQDTDEVLQVVPVGTFGDSDRSSGLVSFLIQREKKLLLATVLLPPTPLEYGSFVNTKTGMTNMGWSVGEVHYMEIGPYFMGCAPTDVSVEDFNFSGFQDAWKEGANAWPSAAAQTHRYGSLQKDYSSLPVVLLRCKSDYGKTYLVDLLAGCSPELTTVVSSPTLASPTGGTVPATTESTATRPARYYRAEEAVLPIPFSLLTKPLTASGEQSSKDKTVPSFVDVNPIDGIVSFVLAGSNTLYVWKEGALVSVTFPKSVESVYSFSPVFFNISLAAEKKVKGILKLVLRGPDAHASYAQLPDGVTANIVDIIPSKDSEGDSQTSITPVTPDELVGSVWVDGVLDRANHVQRVTADGRKLSSDVKYMILEDVNASEKQLEYRLYPTPINTGAEETGYVVDRRQHQLIGVAAENGVERTVNVMDTKDKTQRFLFPLQRDMNSFQINSTHGTAYGYSKDVRELATADLNTERIQQRYNDWNTLLNGSAGQIGDGASAGAEDHVKDYKMEYSTPKKKPSGTLKHGEVDDKEHHGGNTWAGGTGGTDTAGLGGLIGPYRLDKGNPVHQVSPEEKKKVPKHLVDEAKRMGKEALQQRLSEIGMSEEEYNHYRTFSERVRPSVAQLRTLLQGLKAAEGERSWVKGQTDGVWDDKKIVEGIVGDKNVYKRRIDSKENNPFQHTYKKRVLFVLDVSASMYRFEGMDRRLTKLLESTIMVMESFAGFDSKIDYSMIGHNGDSDCIPLVEFGAPPANQRERLIVCQKMVAYAQYCWSGDNTVEAMRKSLDLVTAEKGDSYFVFVISDANLRQYGITPRELTAIMNSKREVQMFCIFIATLGAQASSLQKQLPVGHGYECMQTDALPHILRRIFTSVNLI